MLNLFRRREKSGAGFVPAIPEGRRVYAIGDVHGHLDLLLDLLAEVEQDNARRAPAACEVVMLGDLIDRGPQSAQVLDLFLKRRPDFATFHFLMGNHEESMLRSLETMADPEETGWLAFGGRETMESYGVPDSAYRAEGGLLSDELRRHVPAEHLEFMDGFRDRLAIGNYLFVHAGIRPGVPIERQDPADLRWIRSDFLEDRRDHGFFIVHGHTVTAEPDRRGNRIGIDTGAYRTGVLTALGLEGREQWLLRT